MTEIAFYLQAKRKISEETAAAPILASGRQGSSETEELANVSSDPASDAPQFLGEQALERIDRGKATRTDLPLHLPHLALHTLHYQGW